MGVKIDQSLNNKRSGRRQSAVSRLPGLDPGRPPPFFRSMGKASKDPKREARKQRSEAERQHRELMKRSQKMRSWAFMVAGVVVVLAVVALAMNRRQGGNGMVWSAAHGHYHDAQGREVPGR